MNMKFTYLISWVDKNNLTAMQKVFLVLFGLLFSISLLQAQSVDDLESFGFIEIKTDSMNVSFFIDGYYVGNHPLGGPVPVLPGFHEVSYIPPNIQNEKVRNNLSDGIKRVYVAENDTLEVFLFYDHYLTQIETMENELKIQNYVGFSLIGVLIFVILSIF
tara:strand:- start:208 stop:690 length:483 start_codon:yes stop_codon:yes gene_type:complete